MHDIVSQQMNAEITIDQFVANFRFNKELAGSVREREQYFTVKDDEGVVQRSGDYLAAMKAQFAHTDGWYVGLTEFQLNSRTKPLKQDRALIMELERRREVSKLVARVVGVKLDSREYMDLEIPQNFLPSPSYVQMGARLDPKLLRLAIRTNTTCLEFYMPDLATAVSASDLVQPHVTELAETSRSQRVKHWSNLEKISGQRPIPDAFGSIGGFFEAAKLEGYHANPALCPHVVNITNEGTLRLDCFGSSKTPEKVAEWVKSVREIIAPAFSA